MGVHRLYDIRSLLLPCLTHCSLGACAQVGVVVVGGGGGGGGWTGGR